ncbi:hypothetical protein PtB15_6B92 [Puccinia triticina]|nr:hypothetical protein PtB15_6B92 [Puccinia triticina]
MPFLLNILLATLDPNAEEPANEVPDPADGPDNINPNSKEETMLDLEEDCYKGTSSVCICKEKPSIYLRPQLPPVPPLVALLPVPPIAFLNRPKSIQFQQQLLGPQNTNMMPIPSPPPEPSDLWVPLK